MASQGTVQILTCTNIHVRVMCIHSPSTLWITSISHIICSLCLLHRTVDAGNSGVHLGAIVHSNIVTVTNKVIEKKVTLVVLRLLAANIAFAGQCTFVDTHHDAAFAHTQRKKKCWVHSSSTHNTRRHYSKITHATRGATQNTWVDSVGTFCGVSHRWGRWQQISFVTDTRRSRFISSPHRRSSLSHTVSAKGNEKRHGLCLQAVSLSGTKERACSMCHCEALGGFEDGEGRLAAGTVQKKRKQGTGGVCSVVL